MTIKRYAFVIKDLHGGGAQRSAIYTAEGLRQRGHDVRVFTLLDKIEHRVPEELEVTNLDLITRFTKAFSNVLLEKWQARKIVHALNEYKPDVVVSCSCDKITRHIQDFNLYFRVTSDVSTKFNNPRDRKKAFGKVRRFYKNRKVIAVSEGVRQSLTEVVGLRAAEIRVIYNPYEREPFQALAKEPVNLPEGDYLVHVGTYERRKRQDRLLRAYKASGVTTPLYLLGQGKPEEESKLRALISDLELGNRVIMHGYEINPYPFIRNAKALILTSDAEGLPRVLIEALILLTPVVSVDCPSGPREILTGDLKDFLVNREDEEALAKAIARMDQAPVEVTLEHSKPYLGQSVLPKYEAL